MMALQGLQMRLIDCHLHLQDPALRAALPRLLAEAADAGIQRFICNGTTEADWPVVIQIAQAYPGVVPCFGLHPWFIAGRSADWLVVLQRLLEAHPAAAVGEIGLDRWIEPRNEPDQEAVFRGQLDLARRLHRPVMIHCLRAWGWLMDVLRSEAPLPAGMLIHAYGGPAELIAPLAKMNAWFSFAGNVFEPRRQKAREALLAVPLDRLLIETDAPDMLPPPEYRPHPLGPHNHPANLRAILGGIAALRGLDEAALAEIIWGNAHRLLGDCAG